MLNLQQYKQSRFEDKRLQGAIGAICEIPVSDNSAKILVEHNSKRHEVEIHTSSTTVACMFSIERKGPLAGFGQMGFMDEIELQRKAIAQYCTDNNVSLIRETSAWPVTVCLIA